MPSTPRRKFAAGPCGQSFAPPSSRTVSLVIHRASSDRQEPTIGLTRAPTFVVRMGTLWSVLWRLEVVGTVFHDRISIASTRPG
jgi:hypothetical protein